MLTTSLTALALAAQVFGAAVPNQFVKRQEESSSQSSSMMPTSASSMMSSMSASASASSAAPSASSSQSAAQDLISALNSLGLTSLASLVEPLGDEVVELLQGGGNFTVFTPSNEAISNASLNASDIDAVRQVLSYHAIPVRSDPSPSLRSV